MEDHNCDEGAQDERYGFARAPGHQHEHCSLESKDLCVNLGKERYSSSADWIDPKRACCDHTKQQHDRSE
jgi:hypothetical protein